MNRARRSTLARLQYLAGTTAIATACNSGYAVGDPAPPPASCPADDASVSTAFTASAVWVNPNDATPTLELVVTVKKTDPSFPGTMDLSADSQVQSVVTNAQGDSVLTLRPFVGGSNVDISFALTCDGARGSGTLMVSWTHAPVEGRTETVLIDAG